MRRTIWVGMQCAARKIYRCAAGRELARCAFILALGWMSSGCLATLSHKEPKDRPIRGTAYTLGARRVQPAIGLLGQTSDQLGVTAAVDVGIGKRGQVGINLAHGVLGVLNVRGKANIIDKNGWGLGASAAVLWVNPNTLWILADKHTDPLGDLRIVSIPVRVLGSFTQWDYVGLHLGLGYTHSQSFGDIEGSSTLFEGSLGARKVMLDPRVSFYPANKLELFVAGELQLYGAARIEGVTEREQREGLIVGARAAGWRQLDFTQGTLGLAGVTMKFGSYTYLTVYAYINGALSRSDVIKSPVLPGLTAFWRI